jgi:TPR repeat protein
MLKLIKNNNTLSCYGGRLEYLIGLSEKADVNACFSLGMIYFGGVCKAQDFKNCSSHASCSEFETICSTGKDLKKSFEYISKAAEQGHHSAQFALGYMYQLGKGVVKNNKEAFQWYEKAAVQGYLPAQGVLGDIYYLGLLGFPQDNDKAFVWYKKAREQGDLAAQWNLSKMYSDGLGTKQNLDKSIEYMDKATSDHIPLMPMYYLTLGLRKNLIEAYKMFIIASVFTDPLTVPKEIAATTRR